MHLIATHPSFGARRPFVSATTWNESDKAASASLSNGGLTVTTAQTGTGTIRSVYSASTGRYYWEVTCVSSNTNKVFNIGVGNSSATLANAIGSDANGWGYYGDSGNKRNNNSLTSYGATFAAGDVISVLLDLTAGTLSFWKNGSDQGQAFSGISGAIYAMYSDSSNSHGTVATANFGASPFTYTPPNGYYPGFGRVQ